MPLVGPELIVPAPRLAPAPTGLLVAAQVIDMPADTDRTSEEAGTGGGDERWLAGTRYSPESRYPVEMVDPCSAGWTTIGSSTVNTTALPPSASPNTRVPFRTHRAFVVEQADACSDFGATADEYRGRALRGLLAKEQTAVEDEFETPTIVATNPGLSDGSRVVANAGTTSGSAVVTGAAKSTDIGLTLQGTGIPTRTTVASTAASFTDGASTLSSATFTSASAGFGATDVGLGITGTNIPAGTTILSVTNATTIVLSQNATATGTGLSFSIVNRPVSTSWTMSANATATGTISLTVAVDPNINIVLAGAAQTPGIAFALLQEAIALSNIGQGMIHATAFLVERWAQLFALRFDASGRLTSANGNIVVAGNGYRGVGPDGTGGSIAGGATTQWCYATDLVQIRRAAQPTIYPDNDREALDRGIGVITYRASRPYVIEWSGNLHAACKVNATA